MTTPILGSVVVPDGKKYERQNDCVSVNDFFPDVTQQLHAVQNGPRNNLSVPVCFNKKEFTAFKNSITNRYYFYNLLFGAHKNQQNKLVANATLMICDRCDNVVSTSDKAPFKDVEGYTLCHLCDSFICRYNQVVSGSDKRSYVKLLRRCVNMQTETMKPAKMAWTYVTNVTETGKNANLSGIKKWMKSASPGMQKVYSLAMKTRNLRYMAPVLKPKPLKFQVLTEVLWKPPYQNLFHGPKSRNNKPQLKCPTVVIP